MSDAEPRRPTQTREQAQQRVDRIGAFRRELADVAREGALALTAEQRASLSAYHDRVLDELAGRFDVDRSDAQRQMSLGMRLASLLGAVTLSIAVFLFFYRFWGALSTVTQVVLLTAVPLASLAGIEIAARRERTLYVASLLALVAGASFILDLGVLGSIFNMRPTPNAMLAWAAFALILAYTYRLALMLAAGLVLSLAWLGAATAQIAGLDWTSAALRPEPLIIGGLAVFAASFAPANRRQGAFGPLCRLVASLAVFLPVLLVSGWGEFSYLPGDPQAIEAGYDAVGFALPLASLWIGVRRRWREVVNASSAFFVVFLYAKCFDWCWDWMPRYLFFLLLGALAIVILALLRRLRTRMRQV